MEKENKYKIVYPNGNIIDNADIEFLAEYCNLADKFEACRYYKNGQEISFKDFVADFDTKNVKSTLQIINSKDSQHITNQTVYINIINVGYFVNIANVGDYTNIISDGRYVNISNTGDDSVILSLADYAKISDAGNKTVCKIAGKKSLYFGCGIGNIVRGVKDTQIALCEWQEQNGEWEIVSTITAQIDGVKIKENTYYGIYNGKITEMDLTDDIKSIVLETKGKVKKVQFIDVSTNTLVNKIGYVVADGNGNFAHGETIKEAKKSLLYKISNRDKSQYKNIKLDTELTFEEAIKMYIVITGACEFGVKNFIQQNKIDNRKKYTVKEIIELTKGQYGNKDLELFFEQYA